MCYKENHFHNKKYNIVSSDRNLLENLGLEIRRQLGVDGQNSQSGGIVQVLQPLHNLI